MKTKTNKQNIIIIGAGPAGLSAALNILKTNKNINLTIIEEESVVGGLSRTIKTNAANTDIGPHRFFTKNKDVWKLWTELLPLQGSPSIDDLLTNREIALPLKGPDPEKEDKVFLKRKRFSRIYYQKKFFDYPLKVQSIFNLGIKTSFLIGISYLKSCFFKIKEKNLEAFMINRFGRTLYKLFFEGYTEKVWGVHPRELSDKWGSQRIKGISLFNILKDTVFQLFHKKTKKEVSLIDEYYYPKLGSSQMWETMAEKIQKLGGTIILDHRVTEISQKNNKINTIKFVDTKTLSEKSSDCDIVISSMPIKNLIIGMKDVPEEIMQLAQNLKYRDFILVNYTIRELNLSNDTSFPTINNIAPDSWIYLQDKDIKAGRLDIVNNFSPYMIKNFKNNVVINLEYFCNEGDEFWAKKDKDIIDIATQELSKLHAVDKKDIISANVIRIKKAYPSYIGSYNDFDKIKSYINSIENLYCIGRNGQHKYNNMDHSVSDGIELAKIIKNGVNKKILWDLNTDNKYQEEDKISAK